MSVFRPSVGHKFYIQLALPISPEIMDRFCCSRCLNDCIKVSDMMRLFVGGATTPLVVKIWTKQPWVKIENLLFALPISPEIMDGFWCSRCLNNRIDLPDMIGTFASGANASLVAKNLTKKIIPLPLIKSSPVDGFWYSRCLNNRIDLPDMIETFASGANASLVAKNWTKKIIPLPLIKSSPVDGFWRLKCLYDRINQPDMIGLFASGTNASLVAKLGT